MNRSKKPSFYFHAHANAIGGTLRHPVERVITSRASAALAQAGGYSESREERLRVDHVLSCDAASVHVSGRHHQESGVFRTLVTATIEHLHLLEVVTADRIVAQISVAHSPGEKSRVTLLGTQFVNLKLAGVPVAAKMHPGVFAPHPNVRQDGLDTVPHPAFEDLLEVASDQHKARSSLKHPEWLEGRLGKNDPKKDVQEKGSALCSVVGEVSVGAPGASFAHVLHIPDFGNVYLGELLLARHSFHLTMLRIEMGSMADGDISVCSAAANGRHIP